MTAMRAPSAAEQTSRRCRRRTPPRPGGARRSGGRAHAAASRALVPVHRPVLRPHRLRARAHVPQRSRGRRSGDRRRQPQLVHAGAAGDHLPRLLRHGPVPARAAVAARPAPAHAGQGHAVVGGHQRPGRVPAAPADRLPVPRHRRGHVHHVLPVRRDRAHRRARPRPRPAVPGGHGTYPRRRLAVPHRAAARAAHHAQGLQPRHARRRRQGAARGRPRLRAPARAH